MVVGIDIDGTITRHPEFFSVVSNALISAGHKVVIVTFRERQEAVEARLREWKIGYTILVTSSLAEQMEHGVDEWKAWVCRQHKVEVFIDDSAENLRRIDPDVVSLLVVDRSKHKLEALIKDDGLTPKLKPRPQSADK